jgi:hypothetical protein
VNDAFDETVRGETPQRPGTVASRGGSRQPCLGGLPCGSSERAHPLFPPLHEVVWIDGLAAIGEILGCAPSRCVQSGQGLQGTRPIDSSSHYDNDERCAGQGQAFEVELDLSVQCFARFARKSLTRIVSGAFLGVRAPRDERCGGDRPRGPSVTSTQDYRPEDERLPR